MRFVVIGLLCVMSAGASAHHSASSWTYFHRLRYLICSGSTDQPADKFLCVGAVRAKARILGALDARDKDRTREAAVATVYFNQTDAIPKLRPLLDHQDNFMRVEAAYALAHLGDKQSTAKLADLVRDMEVDGAGTLWADAHDA